MGTLTDEARDLIDEVLSHNTVRVAKFEAHTLRGLVKRVQVSEELAKGEGGLAALIHHDHLRVVAGKKAVFWPEFVRRLGGIPIAFDVNLRVNAGIDFTYNQLSGTSVAVADTLALSNNTLAVAAADTSATLPWSTAQATNVASGVGTGEWTALGLTRKVATTNTHTAAATTYVLAATWTASATVTGTSKIGLFGGAGKASQSSGGTNILCLANTFTATDLANGDSLTVTWTVTI